MRRAARLANHRAGRAGCLPGGLHRTVVTIGDLWSRDATRILQQLDEAISWEARFAWRTRHSPIGTPQGGPPARRWPGLGNKIIASHGSVRVEELAAEIGWGRQRLWSRFRSPDRRISRTRRQADPLRQRRTPLDRRPKPGSGRDGKRVRRPVSSPPGCHGFHRTDSDGAGRLPPISGISFPEASHRDAPKARERRQRPFLHRLPVPPADPQAAGQQGRPGCGP